MLRNILFIRLILLTLPAIFISSCSDDSSTNPNDLNNTGFPLAVGNRWEYRHILSSSDYTEADTTTWISTGVWEITGIEKINNIEAYRMEVHTEYTDGPLAGETGSIVNSYAVMGDTLKWIAYSEREGIFDTTMQLAKETPDVPYFESIAGGWQNLVLIFPLKVGKTWIMHPSDELIGTKTVRKYEKITTPAGKFNGYKISQDIDVEDSAIFELNRWYGPVGLLRSEEYNEEKKLAEDGITTLSRHYHSLMELTGFSLK